MRDRLTLIYKALSRCYGPQHWWPGDSAFEVMVGAVLTQNTNWRNVERAIDNLKRAGCLSLDGLLGVPKQKLAALIRPSGYYNVKTDRLRGLCAWLRENGGIDGLGCRVTDGLRKALLQVHGIGPETADDILLYAFKREVFVIDGYTRRILSRVGLIAGSEPYENLRAGIEAELNGSTSLYGEYHALLVRHAKTACRRQPLCNACCVRQLCAFGIRGQDAKAGSPGAGSQGSGFQGLGSTARFGARRFCSGVHHKLISRRSAAKLCRPFSALPHNPG